MDSNHHTVLLFGDVTDPWVGSIDYVYSQAATKPWLRSFLHSLLSAIRSGTRAMDQAMQDSLRDCSSFQELAERYRSTGDEFGMVHAMLIYVIRALDLLKYVLCSLVDMRFMCLCTADHLKGYRPRATIA